MLVWEGGVPRTSGRFNVALVHFFLVLGLQTWVLMWLNHCIRNLIWVEKVW